MGFEPTISAGERPKTYALDRAATGIGKDFVKTEKLYIKVKVKQSKNRPGVAQGVPGGLVSKISMTFGM